MKLVVGIMIVAVGTVGEAIAGALTVVLLNSF
ncbi:hypothetical protein LCGC14_1119050 [marine sediment metagenome]|uniref:Uncharacterized protein n=1 Tax=marine sediment metagenome TaxID=412755 RepID=A0A0F9PMR4_9ZZZZ